MSLVSIADLKQSEQVLNAHIERVQGLSKRYYDYIAADPGGFKYEVEIGSELKRAPGVHASELSKCQRRLVYSMSGAEKKVDSKRDTNMLMRFRIGHAVHAMLQNDWHRIAGMTPDLLFEDEVKISPKTSEVAKELDITSSCDGIITLLNEGGEAEIRCGLEIKTASPKSFDKLKKPEPDHVEQCMTYMACLDLPLMWVFYYNKGNSNITTPYAPWLFKFDERVWDKIQMRVAKAEGNVSTGALPDREEGMQCKWCPYTHTCQPDIIKSRQPMRISPGMRRST
jgi:CRISPR/Cas system-associated exonuclease Cas4 (RecB family)